MLLDLSTMRTGHDRLERTYPASAFDVGHEEYTLAGPVSLAFDIHKDGNRYHLIGAIKAAIELTCCRCLERFAFPIDASFDLLYLPHTENAGEGERAVEEDDLATAFYRDETIDLGQLIREQFYLALPMKPLCRESCRGLCPVCGTNLNDGECGCARRWEDPRLAGLKALMSRKDD